MTAESAEAEEFAAQLRALKHRSASSYGTLAKRLHISVSTLHRYCHGAAVPASYVAVERFARLCRATPEERIALHQAWIRAGSGRTRSTALRPEPAPQPKGPEPKPASPPEPKPVSPPESEPATLPEPKPEPKPEPEPEPGSAAAHEPEPASRRRPVFRRRLLTGGAAVVTVAVLIAVAAWKLGGDEGGRHAARATPPRSPVAPAAGDPRPTPSPTGSATGTPVSSPSPSAPDRTESQASPSPLSMVVDSHIWEGGCNHTYLIDRPPKRVPPPPVDQDSRAWAVAQGAVHGDTTSLEVTVVAADSTVPAVLQALHVRVVTRRAPLTWPAFYMNGGCGGAITPATYEVNLDAPRPLARPVDGGGPDGEVFPAPRLPAQVTGADPFILELRAETLDCDCEWYLELDWTSDGHSGTVRIDDDGSPFHTSSTRHSPHYGYGISWGATKSWIRLSS